MAPAALCDFCYHQCMIPQGGHGICGVREYRDGNICTLGYAEIVASGVDPVEKKPFYHVLPGSSTLSVALFGCNLTCRFCQNHRISQMDSPLYPSRAAKRHWPTLLSPEELVETLVSSGVPLMSYTYSEPIVWQDYMLATAKLVHQKGLLNCMVTNGSFSPASLERILPWIDAFNIDVKGDDAFYRHYCGGRLAPVLDAIGTIAATPGKVLEVTTLVIEDVHTAEMLKLIGKDLAQLGVKVWHLSRFFPHYRMADQPPSSELFLLGMLEVARGSGIPYIYAGNSSLSEWEQTCCPSCGTLLMASHSYAGEAGLDCAESVVDGKCQACGEPVYGLFSP